MDETKKAYWAGMIDGEGSIVITKTGKYFFLRTMIYQKKKEILEEAKKEFGVGSVGKTIQKLRQIKGASTGESIMHYWHATTNDAEKVLLAILPYLRIKKKQAELALKFQDYKRKTDVRGKRTKTGYKTMSQKTEQKREGFRKKLCELNH